MKVMDNSLFNVEPMKGMLQPGECCTVTLSYKHIMAGTDRLPVLLKLARGREILVSHTWQVFSLVAEVNDKIRFYRFSIIQ